jgi:phosphate transport system substrate-binding protein
MKNACRTETALLAVVLAASLASANATAGEVDPQLPDYQKVEGVSGNLASVGSDTMNNLMTYWAEEFKKCYPNVNVAIEGKGSGTAPPALIAGTAQFGPMSRPMKEKEIDDFEKKFGYKPTCIRTSLDALGVFVNKDNPIKGMTFAQLDAVFSKTRFRKHPQDLTTWGQLGLEGDWLSRPLSLFGRNSASGTYGYFKEHTLKKGDYKDTVKECPGSAAVVQSITEDRFAIGYSGIGYKTAGVRAVPISEENDGDFVEATAENCYAGNYPLSRFLYLYVNKAPNKPLDPTVLEFLKMILSKQGQGVVLKDGYFPLTAALAEEDRAKLSK